MKREIPYLPQLFSRRLFIAIIACGLLMSASAKSKLPTAQHIASKMGVGWNLGNTLEAIGGETAWGAGHTYQRLIDSVKAAGFNTVRLPVSWFAIPIPLPVLLIKYGLPV